MDVKLFISWSGERSGKLAEVFKQFLPKIIDGLESNDIFLSLTDLKSGDIWFSEIQKKLQASDTVLVLLSKENLDSKWLLFESGAISSKPLNKVHIYPIDDIEISSTSPFYNYQKIKMADEENTLKLINSLNSKDNDKAILINFNKYWVNIEAILEEISVGRNIDDTIQIKLKEVENEVVTLVNNNRLNKVFVEAFIGWYSSLIQEVIRPAQQDSFITSSRYYHYCLSALHNSGVDNIKAIADLSNSIENWNDTRIDLWSGVNERTFHIEWKTIIDDKLMDPIIKILQTSLKKTKNNNCKIYLITSKEMKSITLPKLNNQEPLGCNFLFLNPSLIGGYIKDDNHESLYLESIKENSKIILTMRDFYDDVKYNSFQIVENKPNITKQKFINDIRRKWVDKNNFGHWNNTWITNPGTHEYVENYDINIRLWTPNYDKLLVKCAEVIEDEIIKIFRNTHESLRIFEIGYGTGGLTNIILDEIIDINKPNAIYKRGKHNIPVNKYIATDNSSDMKSELNRMLANDKKYNNDLVIDIRDDEFHVGFELEHKVDIIFGSFILHYLLVNDIVVIKNFFRDISDNILVEENASMVFLCTLFSDKKDIKEKQLKSWGEHMHNMGMNDKLIEDYFLGNQRMINSPSRENLKKAAHDCGFTFDSKEIQANSPFSIIILER